MSSRSSHCLVCGKQYSVDRFGVPQTEVAYTCDVCKGPVDWKEPDDD